MSTNVVGELWQSLIKGERDITNLKDSEIEALWTNQMTGLNSIGAIGRIGMLQAELMRRHSVAGAEKSERIAWIAIIISFIATVGALAQLYMSLSKNC